jgi:aprataxin
MSWKTVLKQYATHPNPGKLPPSIRFSHNETTVTVFDTYPKGIFHFLVLPRPTKDLSVETLADLRTLLKGDKQKANALLLALQETSNGIRLKIEKEMLKRYGFKWEIWSGFHAVPSVMSVHLIRTGSLCLSTNDGVFQAFASPYHLQRSKYTYYEEQKTL